MYSSETVQSHFYSSILTVSFQFSQYIQKYKKIINLKF